MAYTFDGVNKLILLSTGTVSVPVADLYSEWKRWVQLADNTKYLPAFRQVGGDPIGGGRYVATYSFLINGWRVRPQEASHTLVIDGNLLVDGGGDPIIPTVGTYNVLVQYTVPVQAQGISTSGGSAPSASQVADAVWAKILESGYSADEIVRLMAAVLLGKVSGAGTGTEVFRDLGDSANRVTSQTDEAGNRLDVTLDP